MSTPSSPIATELRWRGLVERIRRGTCILLLGPGVAIDPDDPDQTPLSVSLARCLATDATVAGDQDLIDCDNLTYVAQLFHRRKKDRIELEMVVDDFYQPFDRLKPDFHQDMAALPFTLCINTTPDNFLYNALFEAGKEPRRDHYNFRRARKVIAVEPIIDKPLVYDLYGSRTEPESLVLTENDRLEFLVNVIKGSPELPPFIRSQFANSDTNFLFVGFGFQQWHNRILLHVLNAQGRRNRSFALEDQTFFTHPDYQQTVVFYANEHLIEFDQFSWLEFAKKLRNTYERSAVKKPGVAPEPPPNAPKVFLCYASEDRDQVEQLNQRLRTAGIDTWQDKQNLRAGDNWDRQLVHVIENRVDYVVVVQTPAMTSQVEGYFYKEIDAALERQKRFATEFRFVLPITLSIGEGMARLRDLHNISLYEPSGFASLIDTIQSDWQRRQGQAVKMA
jgi:TIR domain-containing protein/SIR2-like protein